MAGGSGDRQVCIGLQKAIALANEVIWAQALGEARAPHLTVPFGHVGATARAMSADVLREDGAVGAIHCRHPQGIKDMGPSQGIN